MNITSAALQAAPPSWFYHRHRPFPLSTTKITIVRRISGATLLVKTSSQDSASTSTSTSAAERQLENDDVDPQALQYVSQIKTVLELLKKNRDMLFNEVKLTVLIEDPRDVERRRLLGIDDENAPTRDELADALVQVNEGKIPENRLALQMLAEEMLQWPNLEVEVQKKKPPGKSLYAKFTDTGINPVEAAKMLNMDWDSAAEIEDAEIDDVEVPPAVGYGALYLITAFPVIIGENRGDVCTSSSLPATSCEWEIRKLQSPQLATRVEAEEEAQEPAVAPGTTAVRGARQS
ncbi:ycf3-interacting protein 1, chloroplastic-like [Salvia splendens]|uniref:ycf3-interacting protein 1, chloroplastic-like n=1 Tax=Salvia splendens TaxID=180675 RepID=UPI001C271113|nr:ycf3-interacting protein 1, chloroplastic-like [Salvia splendens]